MQHFLWNDFVTVIIRRLRLPGKRQIPAARKFYKNGIDKSNVFDYHKQAAYEIQCSVFCYADMAELADALVSGTSEGSLVQVQVLLSAPKTVSKETVF